MTRNPFKKQQSREEVRQWDELIDNIMKGEVVPVIGPAFLAAIEEEKDQKKDHTTDMEESLSKWQDPHRALIQMLADTYDITPTPQSFSELLYHEKFPEKDRKDIYALLGEAFQQELDNTDEDDKLFKPSALLYELLRVCKFRFVITTSFTPIVEDAMRQLWGPNIRIMTFSNNPGENDDLKCADDLLRPTVYYMFGKVRKTAKRYVVTDSDMLSFCRSWLSMDETRMPKILVNVLKNKYLLILGNNYSDWLCRFIWYSMKMELDSSPKGMLVDIDADRSLMEFMNRIDAFTHTNPESVVLNIKKRILQMQEQRDEKKFQEPEPNTDVFISYSRRDSLLVKSLYEVLTAKGLRVWYDKDGHSLDPGDDFMQKIKHSIRRTRVFIPLLSHHILEEKNDSHPYRVEWDTAIEVATSYGRNFILPVCEEGLDFYAANIPEKLQKHNAATYQAEAPDFSAFAEKVFNYLMTII